MFRCGSSVAAGASCTISVTFTPQAAGVRSASVTITDNAAGSPHTAALNGSGVTVPQASVSPSTVSFGNQNLGKASAAQTITLSNRSEERRVGKGGGVRGTTAGD